MNEAIHKPNLEKHFSEAEGDSPLTKKMWKVLKSTVDEKIKIE